MKRPPPLDAPRDFRINEMFFSTTDSRGVIRSGNDVFVRVSGYAHDQLVGSAHNIIRHPAMPRAVFRLVWDYLKSERPVAGFIKNLAVDGRHYWVVAFLMPITGGYLSIRFKPSSELLPVVEQLYREMVQRETESAAARLDAKAAMEASENWLLEALRARGFESYDAFMRGLLHDELKSRDAALATGRLALFPQELSGRDDRDPLWSCLAAIHASALKSYAQINLLYAQLDQFTLINQQLAEKSGSVLGLTKDFRFVAFNAALRSARLGEEGRSLSVIAEYLNGCSTHASGAVGDLITRIGAISARLRAIVFDFAAARLQIEMVLVFCAELAAGRHETEVPGAANRQQMILDLQSAFADTANRAVLALGGLADDLRGLSGSSEEMRRMVLTLQVAQVGGLVEASRLRNDDSFVTMFDELREGVAKTKAALGDVDDASARLAALANHAPAIAVTVNEAVAAMADAIRSLPAAGTEPPQAKPGPTTGTFMSAAHPTVAAPAMADTAA